MFSSLTEDVRGEAAFALGPRKRGWAHPLPKRSWRVVQGGLFPEVLRRVDIGTRKSHPPVWHRHQDLMNRLAEQVDKMLVLSLRLFRHGGADVDELRLAKPQRYHFVCVCLHVWPERCATPLLRCTFSRTAAVSQWPPCLQMRADYGHQNEFKLPFLHVE
jgi:hypothetical protein